MSWEVCRGEGISSPRRGPQRLELGKGPSMTLGYHKHSSERNRVYG